MLLAHNQNDSQPVIKGAIHLGLRDAAESADQIENRRDRPATSPNPGLPPLGQDPRQVAGNPPSGDMRYPFYRVAPKQGSTAFRLDAGRLQQLLPERATQFRDPVSAPQPLDLQKRPARPRVAVAVQSARGESDKLISGDNCRRGGGFFLLHPPHRDTTP